MSMVNIRIVRVRMTQGLVTMPVTVCLGQQFRIRVMLMMFIVTVTMFMFHRLMNVFVLMSFGQMQPDSNAHQHCRD